MKITKICLKDFHQFNNIEIDLTYPKGHPKADEPLDKVCFIGQSGTGKTTLLNIISGYTRTLKKLQEDYEISDFEAVKVYVRLIDQDIEINVSHNQKENEVTYIWRNVRTTSGVRDLEILSSKQPLYSDETKTHLVYFPADLKFDFNAKNEKKLTGKIAIDFSEYNLANIWSLVLEEVQNYREQLLSLQQKIAEVAIEDNVNTEKIIKESKKLENWKKKNKNPLDKLADECLDVLLNHFKLRVKRNFKFTKQEDLKFIDIEDLYGNPIPQSLFSTGTKQVIFSATPLYLLKTEEALILFDEPERSLYPNIQKIIIDFYTSLAKNSQFFFATHSPIIASSFEPWEIVELKFDNKGKVYQELYYDAKKERHVDNYTIVPSYLTYDLMLNKVFDLKETYSTERSDKITEVLMLRNQIKSFKEKDKLQSKEAKLIIERYKKLAEKLFWEFEI